jgi:hypothetical protein
LGKEKSMKRIISLALFSVLFTLNSCKKNDPVDPNIMTKNGIQLSSSQEVPAFTSTATGTVDIQYMKKENMIHYTLTWNNLSGAPTGMHFHGPADIGVNAGVLQGITGFPASASGTITGSFVLNETTQKSADLLAGKWYVNVHTAAKTGGEIRAQIIF